MVKVRATVRFRARFRVGRRVRVTVSPRIMVTCNIAAGVMIRGRLMVSVGFRV